MPKSTNKVRFYKAPIPWLICFAQRLPLPLMWKMKIMGWGVSWMIYRRHFKDQLLGELQVVVISVEKDWETHQGKLSVSRVRDITYRWKRAKLPFSYRKVYRGTQCTDETAHPLGLVDPSVVVSCNDSVAQFNIDMTKRNEQYENHQKLKASIVNHKFQEYDHDL